MHSFDTFISDLPTLERAMVKIAEKIDIPKEYLPTFGYSRDGGYPHVEQTQDGFHLVFVERGQEFERRTTKDSDEILYWIFESATFSMACNYELKHRIVGQDCRRIGFQRQLELLGKLNISWMKRESEEHERILKDHPYRDSMKTDP